MEYNTIQQCDICKRNFEFVGRRNQRVRKHPELICGGSPHRCDSCQSNKNRVSKKLKLIEYGGGKCSICGYSKCPSALVFHHIDPSKKNFTISSYLTCSIETIYEEINNCILLCANCHAEIHDGMTSLPNVEKKNHIRVPQHTQSIICPLCGNKKSKQASNCKKCADKKRINTNTKISWPPLNILLDLLQTIPCTTLAKQLGVSDKAITKHIKKLQERDSNSHHTR